MGENSRWSAPRNAEEKDGEPQSNASKPENTKTKKHANSIIAGFWFALN